MQKWKSFININKKTKILEIGCGPYGVLNFIPFGEKYSVDPLADFYKEKFNFEIANQA